MRTDVLVIGGGAAGLAAAVSAAKSGADVTLVESGALGGTLTRRIDESFGTQTFGKLMTGREYVRRYTDMLSAYPRLRVIKGVVTALSADKTAEVVNPKGCFEYKAKAVVLATGSRERSVGMLDVGGTHPAGIMTAGAALKAMNVDGKRIGTRAVVLGSGESGVIAARRLTLEGVKVECVTERMPYPAVSPDIKVYCLDDYRIPLLLSAEVKEIRGDRRVREVVLSQNGEEKTVRCDLLVIAAGRMPLNALYGFIKRGAGGPETDSHCMTSAAGFFICGNALRVRAGADNVSEEGETAGRYAAEYAANGAATKKAFWLTPSGNVTEVCPRRFIAGEGCYVSVRTSRPIRNGSLVLMNDVGEIVARIGKKSFFPGDETTFYLTADDVNRNLYVGAEECL